MAIVKREDTYPPSMTNHTFVDPTEVHHFPSESAPSSGYQTPSGSSASLPYFLVPNTLPPIPIPDMNKRPRPSFPVPVRPQTQPQQPPSLSSGGLSMSPENRLQMQLNQSIFKAPQHKHAHHLHSIPPREKTTRTLILDHMLWLHGRARFAQARAELGLDSEKAGGDDDDEEYLTFNDDCGPEWNIDEKRDALHARSYKAKAEGMEKVLSAMLDQPPEDLPFDADDLLFRDTSFSMPTTPTLPNGVRLRLLLAGLINDVFSEDDVTVPLSLDDATQCYHSQPPLSTFSANLSALARLSSFSDHQELPTLPSFRSLTAAADLRGDRPPAQSIVPPAGSIFSTIPRGAGPESPWALGSTLGSRQSLLSGTGNGSFASSSSGMNRARFDMPPPPPPRVLRAVGRARELYSVGTNRASGSSGPRPHRCPHHLTYNCPPSSFCVASRNTQSPTKTSKSKTHSSIGAGLSVSGPPLRRSALSGKTKGQDARMTDLLPRFLRLSALVAIELGREAKGDEDQVEDMTKISFSGKRKKPDTGMSSADSNDSFDSDDESVVRKVNRIPARPTKLWYQLLAGILTRAVLQGYLVKGWKGTDAIEVLLGVGMGRAPDAKQGEDVEDESEEKEFEPDDIPDLTDTWRILFGFKAADSSASIGTSRTMDDAMHRDAYDEYKRMMEERITDFFTISQNMHDLTTHLDHLARKYPSEPVDRAVLRFCEAVAKWRGMPELETYKGRPPSPPNTNGKASTSNASIHAVLNTARSPAPATKPLIDRYFYIPSSAERQTWERIGRRDSVSSSGTKRSRRNSWVDGKGKKPVVDQAWVEEEEYVGPYGL